MASAGVAWREEKAFLNELEKATERCTESRLTRVASLAIESASEQYKLVTHLLDRQYRKASSDKERLNVVYVVSEILRSARKEVSKGPSRYFDRLLPIAKSMFMSISDQEMKDKISKILALWTKEQVYSPEVIQDMCDAVGCSPAKASKTKGNSTTPKKSKRRTTEEHVPMDMSMSVEAPRDEYDPFAAPVYDHAPPPAFDHAPLPPGAPPPLGQSLPLPPPPPLPAYMQQQLLQEQLQMQYQPQPPAGAHPWSVAQAPYTQPHFSVPTPPVDTYHLQHLFQGHGGPLAAPHPTDVLEVEAEPKVEVQKQIDRQQRLLQWQQQKHLVGNGEEAEAQAAPRASKRNRKSRWADSPPPSTAPPVDDEEASLPVPGPPGPPRSPPPLGPPGPPMTLPPGSPPPQGPPKIAEFAEEMIDGDASDDEAPPPPPVFAEEMVDGKTSDNKAPPPPPVFAEEMIDGDTSDDGAPPPPPPPPAAFLAEGGIASAVSESGLRKDSFELEQDWN